MDCFSQTKRKKEKKKEQIRFTKPTRKSWLKKERLQKTKVSYASLLATLSLSPPDVQMTPHRPVRRRAHKRVQGTPRIHFK